MEGALGVTQPCLQRGGPCVRPRPLAQTLSCGSGTLGGTGARDARRCPGRGSVMVASGKDFARVYFTGDYF